MPTLDFKGKQFIYGHHLTVPISTIEIDAAKSLQIAKACKETGKKAYVSAPQKFVSQKELTDMGITFCQLPYNIHRIADV